MTRALHKNNRGGIQSCRVRKKHRVAVAASIMYYPIRLQLTITEAAITTQDGMKPGCRNGGKFTSSTRKTPFVCTEFDKCPPLYTRYNKSATHTQPHVCLRKSLNP